MSEYNYTRADNDDFEWALRQYQETYSDDDWYIQTTATVCSDEHSMFIKAGNKFYYYNSKSGIHYVTLTPIEPE